MTLDKYLILSFTIFLISATSTKLSISFLGKKLKDEPNHRSAHSLITPRVGGIGIFISIIFYSILFNPLNIYQILFISLLFSVGALDDFLNLNPITKLSGQVIACLPIIIYIFNIYTLQFNLFSMGICLISLLSILTLVNFYNFMDGANGLIGLNSIIQLIAISYFQGNFLPFIFSMAILGFLIFNFPKAKTFLGDSGSHLIPGLLIISILEMKPIMFTHLTIYFLLLLPIVGDAFITIIRRLINAENILQSHSSHLYQRAMKKGASHVLITLAYSLMTLVIILILSSFYSYGSLCVG